MHFQLPDNIKQEVIKYDKTLKVLATEPNKPSTQRKVSHPKGNVQNLIPTDVVRQDYYQTAIDQINKASAANSFHQFKRPVLGQAPETYAVIYHHRQLWVALWLPNRQDDGYLYGISIAFRDNSTARKMMAGKEFMRYEDPLTKNYQYYFDIDDMTHVKYGKSYMYQKSIFVTKDMITDGLTNKYWYYIHPTESVKSYGRSSRDKYTAIREWEDTFMKSIPVWKDSRFSNWHERLTPKGNSLWYCLSASPCLNSLLHLERTQATEENYKHTVDDYINYCLESSSGHCDANELVPVYNKPFMRKRIQRALTESQEAYDVESQKQEALVYKVKSPMLCLERYLDSCKQVLKIWPDCPIDYLQQHEDELTEVRNIYSNNSSHEWLRTNMPVASFFKMLYKARQYAIDSGKEFHYQYNSTLGVRQYRIDYWHDTTDMIAQLLAAQLEVPRPRRWRIKEFHDFLMAETWKIKNPKVDLPQKLFPNPIKVTIGDDNYTLLQPHDTHQLAQWGKAVRNCVGSSGYASGIKKHKHLIVLIMLNGHPRYTVQLTVDNGMMTVDQIADICNKTLTDDQRNAVQQAFSQALQLQADQLRSV
jgi:hypothetical protein